MRSFKHWTPRYIINRLVELIYNKVYHNNPWFTHNANTILSSLLKNTDIGFEFGSGKSTIWIASKVKRLISVEHNIIWYKRINKLIINKNINNVEYYLIPNDGNKNSEFQSKYVRIIDKFKDNMFDFIIIDGIYREFTVLESLKKIRTGGFLIIDNINWYLPSKSYSPDSRTIAEGPINIYWEKIYKTLINWRIIWTTNGVSDTAFFFKPCNSNKV